MAKVCCCLRNVVSDYRHAEQTTRGTSIFPTREVCLLFLGEGGAGPSFRAIDTWDYGHAFDYQFLGQLLYRTMTPHALNSNMIYRLLKIARLQNKAVGLLLDVRGRVLPRR